MVVKILAMEESETLINDIGKFVNKEHFTVISTPIKKGETTDDLANLALCLINRLNSPKVHRRKSYWGGMIITPEYNQLLEAHKN